MKALHLAIASIIISTIAFAADKDLKQHSGMMHDCPMWSERQQTIDDMHNLLEELRSDCAKRKDACDTSVQIDRLINLNTTLREVHERARQGQQTTPTNSQAR